jgi:hypothetical protein
VFENINQTIKQAKRYEKGEHKTTEKSLLFQEPRCALSMSFVERLTYFKVGNITPIHCRNDDDDDGYVIASTTIHGGYKLSMLLPSLLLWCLIRTGTCNSSQVQTSNDTPISFGTVSIEVGSAPHPAAFFTKRPHHHLSAFVNNLHDHKNVSQHHCYSCDSNTPDDITIMSSLYSKKSARQEEQEDEADPTARAYANISEALKQWTSPSESRRSPMDDDDDNEEEEDEDLVMIDQYRTTKSSSIDDNDDELNVSDGLVDWLKREISTTANTPNSMMMINDEEEEDSKRPAMYMLEEPERASTPVTSNSSNQKTKKSGSSIRSSKSDRDSYFASTPAPKTPMGVVSPWNNSMDISMQLDTFSPPMERVVIPSLEHASHEYRRYHDAILALRSARLSLNHRLELMQQEVTTLQEYIPTDEDDDDDDDNNNNAFLRLPPSYASYVDELAQEERAVELNFLQALASTCWDRSASAPQNRQQQQTPPQLDLQSQKEATLWMLLYHLRCGGLATLIWPDDVPSQRQTFQAMQHHLTQVAMIDHSNTVTPLQLVEALQQTDDDDDDEERDDDDPLALLHPPILLQRRKHILDWLSHFFDRKMMLTSKQQQQSSSKHSQTMSVWSLPDAPSLIMESDNDGTARSRTRHMHHPDDETMESDHQLFTSCLEYLLAGRLEDAQAYCRRQPGQTWRAAQWSGGVAWGKRSSSSTATGNPARAAWKRHMWNLSQQCHQVLASSSTTGSTSMTRCCWEEAAMYAILSQDLKSCLSNRALRTWEHGLYVSFAGMWGRMEDEVLHRHYHQRRRQFEELLPSSSDHHDKNRFATDGRRRYPPFPGMAYEQAEVEQLQATGEIASMTEATVLRTLSVSPWEDMRGQDPVSIAMAAFLLGKSAILQYMQQECEQLEVMDATHLRVLTHLALYLQSLDSSAATPVILDNMVQIKNVLVDAYVQHLSQHPELWHMLVLYSSFLPEDLILEVLPDVLTQVQHDEERRGILDQLHGILPPGLDLVVLRRLVRLILSTSDGTPPSMSGGAATTMMTSSTNTPSRSDMYKMKAIGWLYHDDEHMGDALVCSNILLRQFLSRLRMKSAQCFLHEYAPPLLITEQEVETSLPQPFFQVEEDDEADDEHDNQKTLVSQDRLWSKRASIAQTEFLAYQSYITAFSAFEEWKTTVKNSSPLAGSFPDDFVDESFVEGNSSEQAAISYMERRGLLKSKRKACEAVVGVAETARRKLMDVLTLSGGWLVEDDIVSRTQEEEEEEDAGMMEEEERRLEELKQLRCHHLPLVVSMLHQVCEETAMWLARLLDGCVPRLAHSPRDVLAALDEDVVGTTDTDATAATLTRSTSPLSPKYWSQHAMDICNIVADDGKKIYQAFGAADLKELLEKVAETAVNHLLYEA